VSLFPVAILAGGLATRLRPLTETIAKSLVEVNGKPFIAHQLRLLKEQGVEQVVFCTSFLGEQIKDFVGDGAQFGLQVQYSDDGAVRLGTGGAIRKALPLLGRDFFTLYGDSYLTCDFAAVQRAFETGGRRALMTVFWNRGSYDQSNVEFRNGHIISYNKALRTASMQHIDYGLGVFNSDWFQRYPLEASLDLAWVYQDALAVGQLIAFEVSERFYEIGSFSGIRELSEHLSARAKY